ncbi:Uncharacterised protein [Mycobacteroides abscessus subsp. abscessus]|nr:Uncharacterised protein [Mycobacteroides abscessus subsp. abscessus]SIG22014.1 Uncharacterised protein [Mycobacteroides abscessus subsp. abscessus]
MSARRLRQGRYQLIPAQVAAEAVVVVLVAAVEVGALNHLLGLMVWRVRILSRSWPVVMVSRAVPVRAKAVVRVLVLAVALRVVVRVRVLVVWAPGWVRAVRIPRRACRSVPRLRRGTPLLLQGPVLVVVRGRVWLVVV